MNELRVVIDTGIVVIGDADLLTMNPFRGVSIVTAREFVNAMRSNSP